MVMASIRLVAVCFSLMFCFLTFIGLFPTGSGLAAAVGLLTLLVYSREASVEKLVDQLKQQNGTTTEGPTIVKFPGVNPLIVLSLMLALPAVASAQTQMMELSPETRMYYHNPDGSCVQCSIGMLGCHCNDINAATLLWDTVYGPAERGGSNPSRVEAYCDRRGIRALSVTGNSINDTMPWLEWAARTGRFAAFGAGSRHFQTLYGFDPATREWFVCNNQTPGRIDRYSEADFREIHRQSGPWLVILETPSSANPVLSRWWK